MKTFLLKKNFKFISFLAIVFIFLKAISTAIFGVLIGELITNISNSNLDGIKNLIFICVFSLVVTFVSANISRCSVVAYSLKKILDIKNKIFQYDLTKARGESVDFSNFTTKITTVYSDYFVGFFDIIYCAILFLFSVFLMIYIDWIMLVTAIFSCLLPMIVPIIFGKKLEKYSVSYNNLSKNYLDFISDILKGRIEIIKNNVFDTYNKRHIEENFSFESSHYKNVNFQNFANYFSELLGGLSFFILFAVGGILVYYKRINVGQIVASIQLFNYLVSPVMKISDLLNKRKAAKPIYDELLEKTKVENVDSSKICVKNFDLTVSNLSFSYDDSKEDILTDFSKTFYEGKKYLIQGKSGSGKTTFAKILACELPFKNGEIKLGDKNLKDYSYNEISRIIQYVDQESYLFNDTINNNITMYREIDKVYLDSLKDNLSIKNLNFEDFVNDELGLSGGQKARINIARSLINNSSVYIFDEPTAALDFETELKVIKYLLSLKQTVIVISHLNDERILNLFDEVIKF